MIGLLARMCAHTGRSLTWEQAVASRQRLAPERYAFDAPPPPAEVAIPGVTPFE